MSGYVERLRALLGHLDEISRRADRARPGDTRTERQIVADFVRQSVDPAELRDDLRAALDELGQRRSEQRQQIDQAYGAGWYDATYQAIAGRGPNMQGQVAGLRKYHQELAARGNAASAPQQPERCTCGCPRAGNGCNCRFCNEPYPTQQPAREAAERIQAWRNQLDADSRAWFVTYGHPIPEPLHGPDEEVPGHYGYGTGLIGPNGELPLLLADLDAVLAGLGQPAQEQELCGDRAHRDFVGDQTIQCEQPKGHFWHRNGQRQWAP